MPRGGKVLEAANVRRRRDRLGCQAGRLVPLKRKNRIGRCEGSARLDQRMRWVDECFTERNKCSTDNPMSSAYLTPALLQIANSPRNIISGGMNAGFDMANLKDRIVSLDNGICLHIG